MHGNVINQTTQTIKQKGVYHLPTDHSSDIMVVVVEPQHCAGAFFVL
nr:MAG TPA: hypothetical protein [Caudoviricetes sp.]